MAGSLNDLRFVLGFILGVWCAFASMKLAPWIAALQARNPARRASYPTDEAAADFEAKLRGGSRPVHDPLEAPIPRR